MIFDFKGLRNGQTPLQGYLLNAVGVGLRQITRTFAYPLLDAPNSFFNQLHQERLVSTENNWHPEVTTVMDLINAF